VYDLHTTKLKITFNKMLVFISNKRRQH